MTRPARRIAFYTGLLDAHETFRYPDDGPAVSVGLALGDSEFHVVLNGDVEPGSPGRVLLSIDVPDVDALLDRVAGLGGRGRGPANDMPWGQRVGHITDPDGNVVNLTQSF